MKNNISNSLLTLESKHTSNKHNFLIICNLSQYLRHYFSKIITLSSYIFPYFWNMWTEILYIPSVRWSVYFGVPIFINNNVRCILSQNTAITKTKIIFVSGKYASLWKQFTFWIPTFMINSYKIYRTEEKVFISKLLDHTFHTS